MQSTFNNLINPKFLGKGSIQQYIMVFSLLAYGSLYGQRISIGVAEFGSVVVAKVSPFSSLRTRFQW